MKPPKRYPVLDDRPIDQWKVTELKEELKRRKKSTKGLKEDLVKRLDKDIRVECELALEDEFDDLSPKPDYLDEAAKSEVTVMETGYVIYPENSNEITDNHDGKSYKVDYVSVRENFRDGFKQLRLHQALEEKELELLEEHLASSDIIYDDLSSGDLDDKVLLPETVTGAQGLQVDVMERAGEDLTNQVSDVSTNLGFAINSVSTDFVSVNEKNEVKDNIIADNVRLESDVKLEMVQPSSSGLVGGGGGESHPEDVDEPQENKDSVEETDNNVTTDTSRKNPSVDLGSSEKLNLDRSSGDDSMEEDALESKQTDSKYNSEEVSERIERSEDVNMKEGSFTAMDTDLAPEENVISENKDVVASSLDKRKLPEQEAALSNEPSKRQRKWKSESSMAKERQISNVPLAAAEDVPKPVIPKRNFLRSDSIGTGNNVKEHEVPPSTKVATNSLRIDRFLRPFTLKALQELLSKTGTVTSFWMDHIKTHCYVTFKSVEEAVETRNAVYNLQWPPNGGRNLVADFVDPEEVKLRVEPPPPPPLPAPMSTGTTTVHKPSSSLPQFSQQNLNQQKSQQPTLPPPPPLPAHLSNRALAREFVHAPPSPPPEKVEAPILTLDDLFRKTKATPRIYYLPLSEERVSTILERRKNSGQ